MATFKDQLDNFRIKTLSQDLLQQPTSVGQYWDTMGLEVSEIAGANFWDLTMRPLQTNDVIMARIHGASDDSAILGEMRFLSAYCKLINPRKYASHLLPLYNGDSYAVADIADVNSMTASTSKTVALLSSSSVSDVYVYFDGKSTNGISVTIGGTTKSFANTASYGEVLHFDSLSISGASFTVTIVATSGDSSLANLHIVAVASAGSSVGGLIDLTTDVTGVLPTANGGTGANAFPSIDLTSGVTGVLPTANGGTGASSFPSIDLTSDVTGVLPVANGGTGLNELGLPGAVLTVSEDGVGAEWAGGENPPQQ